MVVERWLVGGVYWLVFSGWGLVGGVEWVVFSDGCLVGGL